ncbi:MAG: helix-turn-helix domain-containing protein [Ktedonobacteraceae bacterium]|nr:helix-turn-helix domain-containing protein [Ktedonobacteraceae bacterium]
MAMKAAKDLRQSRYLSVGRNNSSFYFQPMEADPHALERLDIRIRWGRYGVQVLKWHLISFEAGSTIPYHKHREYEFHFIPSGKGLLTLDEGTFPVQSGMFYLTGPQVMHQQEIDPRDPMSELCLHVDIIPLDQPAREDDDWGEALERVEAEECVRQLNIMPAFPALDRYDAMSYFLTAYNAWRDRELGAYNTIRQSIIQILLRAARAHNVTQIQPALPSRDMNAYRYQLATQYIRDNYARPITLDEVAQGLHICGRQLQRILDEQAGETFSGYLEHYRLTQVCRALVLTEQTVEQLAVQHGFSSGSYLHYVFKKRMGTTPLRYREQWRRENGSAGG